MRLFNPEFHVLRATAAGLTFSLLAACGGGGGSATPAPSPAPAPAPSPAPTPALPPKVGVADLTTVSADNYAHNRFGLIEAATLQTYVSNWRTPDTAAANLPPNGRPANLAADARLVVLQLNGANPANDLDYVQADPANNVFVYELDSFRFNAIRDTGLISNSVRYQADGATVDSWLAKYGINLSRDFVVFANGSGAGTPAGAFFQDLGRGSYWLSYWGADARNIAVVNGTLEKNYTGTLVSTKTADSSVSNGNFTVKSIRRDQTGITVPFEDVLSIVDAGSRATNVVTGFSQQLIVDARPAAQFNRTATGSFNDTFPGQFITTAWNSAGAPSNDAAGRAKNYVLYEGHIKGAVAFPWVALVEDVGGSNIKFKTKSALEALYTAAGYAPSDRSSKVIVSQCRTNFEAQVNGFASRQILGYPTVFFDGSLVEYTSLVENHPDTALNLRPTDPAYRFRTDTAARSQKWVAGANGAPATTTRDDSGVTPYNVASGTGADDRKIAQAVINRNATTTRRALDADVEYKRQ